jgi:serine/threonine-protein phosphatase PGAM5
MATAFKTFLSKPVHVAPIVAAGITNYYYSKKSTRTACEKKVDNETFSSQVYQPKRPYPAWDSDWDGKQKDMVKHGVTRHIILVRHGQYDETFKEDEKRILTPLGRKQAHLTGERLKEMIGGIDDKFKAIPVGVVRVSNMARAKETASIISSHLPSYIERSDPDELLNEGIPAQIIPSRPELDIDEDLAKNGPRIEEAFQKYFYRSTDENSVQNHVNKHDKHEFEIVVCHGNVIRYFFCRALQLPPEAWLRLSTYNCSLTYLMIKPSGNVSCRMLGDIGHLGYGHSTFSQNHGFVP